MTVSYSTTLKTNRMQIMSDMVSNKVAGASTGTASAGKLVIGTASLSGATGVLVTIPLATTPFTISGAVATLAGTPLSAAASGAGTQTAALAAIRTSADVDVVTGLTVGTSGTDVILNSTSITNGQTVTISGAPPSTITHSA